MTVKPKDKPRQPISANFIRNIDCVGGMRDLPSESVDLIVTDPPFAIDFKAKRSNYNRKGSRVLEGYSEVQADEYLEFTQSWMGEAYRLLKSSGSAFVFSGWNNLKDILNVIDEVGFITINHIIWKYQFGVATRRKFVSSHYHCLFICKDDKQRKFFVDSRYSKNDRSNGGRSLRYRDMEDVWAINREYWTGDIKTPTKLPCELIKKILSYTSEQGDIVLDPFLGSGQVAVVAQMMGRKYIGYEIVPEYFNFAQSRLKEKQYRFRAEDVSMAANETLPIFGK
ncbi:MAG: site-specific DNA-methyltransferase [Candidatus Poribacteria bacterium]|nr:site-specific DNA-methyltransferase [Candidatus Poribacteria bacterium]